MRALATMNAALLHRAAVDEGRRVAGDEDEDLGRVGEAVIADRHPVDDVRRDMVDENQPEREAAKQVEPQVVVRLERLGSCTLSVASRSPDHKSVAVD